MADTSDRRPGLGDGRKQPTEADTSPVIAETDLQSEEPPETGTNRQSWTISTGRNKSFSSDHATSWSIETAVEVMSGYERICLHPNTRQWGPSHRQGEAVGTLESGDSAL